MVRRNLDDARDAIGLSFRLVWGDDYFLGILSRYEDNQNTVSWYSFKEAFNTLYNSYIVEADDGSLVQTRSIFGEPVFKDKASNGAIEEVIATSGIVEESYQSLRRKYRFFVPAFIWKYNSLKRYLVTVEEKLYALYVAVNADAAYLKDLDPDSNDEPALQPLPSRPPPVSERFEHGTALRFRQGEKWKRFISGPQSRTRNKKRPSLDNTDDVSKSMRMAGPSHSAAGPSSTSEGMPFSSRASRHIG